jgi:hypothetical protein
MNVAQTSAALPRSRPGRLSTVGFVIVLTVDVALALLFAYVRYSRYPQREAVELLGETLGYAGCSMLCPLVGLTGLAAMIAKLAHRPLGLVLFWTLFWAGLTIVPAVLLLLALQAAMSVR